MLLDDPGLTPGLDLRGDSRPIESFYQVPADSIAPSNACCLRAAVVSRLEFIYTTICPDHGERSGGNAD